MAEVKESEEMKCSSPVFYLIASTEYAGYLPFSATKVSERRKREMKGNVLLLAVKSLHFNMIKNHDF